MPCRARLVGIVIGSLVLAMVSDIRGEAPATRPAILLPARIAPPAESRPTVQTLLESSAGLLATGKPREALETLRTVEQLEPENPWMWFYRGHAHQQIGNPYRAMECYDHALETLAALSNPDPALAQTARRCRAQARREVFNISLQAGLAYDTNVSYTGGGGTLGLISGRSDGRFASGARFDYAPIADENETLALGGRLGHSWHGRVEQFNFQDYGGYLRYAHRLGENWEAALRYDYDLMYLGNEPFLSDHAVTPSLIYHWPTAGGGLRPVATEIYYRGETQDFLFATTPAFDRDGWVNSFGIEQRFQTMLYPVRYALWHWQIGYRFDSFATEGSEFDRRADNFYVGLQMPVVNPADMSKYLLWPDRELTFSFTANWELDDYRRDSLIDDDRDRRRDRLTTLTFALAQTLFDDPDRGKLVLHGLISMLDADSNVSAVSDQRIPWSRASPFTYDKVVYALQLEWSW